MENGQPRMTAAGPDIVHVCLPVQDVEVHDTWHVSGLCGTGSHDFSAKDLFVPDQRVFLIGDPTRACPEPLCRMPVIAWYVAHLAAVRALGDDLPVAWIGRDARYAEKLATPDTSVADLIGDVDPIRVAEGRYLSDELTIHYGLVPRTNRGIFAINELPDLAERIQVGLFNIMEERDIQIRGYQIRLNLDVFLVSSANPEDYTNRGRIITPLKDRFDVQIRTHYPKKIEDEIQIMEQDCPSAPSGVLVIMSHGDFARAGDTLTFLAVDELGTGTLGPDLVEFVPATPRPYYGTRFRFLSGDTVGGVF